MARPTEASVHRKWRPRGFTTNRWSDPGGNAWAVHQHPVSEIVLPVSGQVVLRIGQKTVKPKVGTEVDIPPKTPHSIQNPGRTRSQYFFGFKK